MSLRQRVLLALAIFTILFAPALLVLLSCPVFGQSGNHGDGHREYHDFYRDLKQPGTDRSCCNGDRPGIEGDCRPVRGWLIEDGIYGAILDGKLTPIDPGVVIHEAAPDGNAHICRSKSGTIYCFIAPAPKS